MKWILNLSYAFYFCSIIYVSLDYWILHLLNLQQLTLELRCRNPDIAYPNFMKLGTIIKLDMQIPNNPNLAVLDYINIRTFNA